MSSRDADLKLERGLAASAVKAVKRLGFHWPVNPVKPDLKVLLRGDSKPKPKRSTTKR